MDTAVLKQEALRIEKQYGDEFVRINTFLFEHPELGLEEYESAAHIAEYLAKRGFAVEMPYADFPTAFRAQYGERGPLIAFLAEYDALPGYGPEKKNGHACGHNFIASTCVGAAVVLKELADKLGVRVAVIGTPAEETYCAKVAMIESGVFSDVDVCLQVHLFAETSVYATTLAMNSFIFNFRGKASHAAAAPWDGINALDAVIQLFNAVNALRQHVTSDVRIHGIITEGGQAANIVPDKASCLFYVRSASREYLNTVIPKVLAAAEGAALMTGAELTVEYPELPMDDVINLPTLQKLACDNFAAAGLPPTGTPESGRLLAGSSDIGNVSHVCPTMYIETALSDGTPVRCHEESALALVDCPVAHDTLHRTVNALAGMVIDMAAAPAIIERARAEFAAAPK